MTIRIGYRGQSYDDVIPLYVDLQNGFVFNRMDGAYLSKAGLQAAMAVDEYVPHEKELAKSLAWEANNRGDWSKEKQTVTVTQPTGLPITGDATGTQFVSIGSNFGAGGVTEICTATVTYKIGTDAAKTISVKPIVGNTSTQANTAIAAAITGSGDGLTATATASVIKVTPADTVVLTSMSMAVV